MKMRFRKTMGILLSMVLFCSTFISCSDTKENSSKLSDSMSTSSESEGGLLGAMPSDDDDYDEVVEKDEDYISEDEKWGRIVEGMLGEQGEVVDKYNGFLGYGYNMITSAFYNQNDIDSAHPVVNVNLLAQQGKIYIDDANVAYSYFDILISNSTKNYAESLSQKASVRVIVPLTGSFKANFNRDTSFEMTSNQRLITTHAYLQKRKDYILENSPELLAGNLADGFKESVEKIYKNPTDKDIINFIDMYGTHVLTSVIMGGRFDLNYIYTSESTIDDQEIFATAQATYRYVTGNTEQKYKEAKSKIEEKSEIYIRTYGGSLTVNPTTIDMAISSYTEWSQQVENGKTTLVNAHEVVPIWDIINAMGEEYSGFANAVKEYCEKEISSTFGKFKDTKGVVPPAKTYISEIYIGYGNSEIAAKAMLYNKDIPSSNIINLDLNKGAGGEWIYLGYKTTNSRDEAITNIVADYYGKKQSKNIQYEDSEMQIINVDLNKGARGKYIYLYYTRDSKAGKPITDIKGLVGKDVDMESLNGYNGVICTTNGQLMDFNKGAGLSLIHI